MYVTPGCESKVCSRGSSGGAATEGVLDPQASDDNDVDAAIGIGVSA